MKPTFSQLRTFDITKDWKIIKLNCDNAPEVCTKYGVNRYPTIKFFFEGKELTQPVGRQLKTLLSAIAKLSELKIEKLTTEEELAKFTSDYGYVTFVLSKKASDSPAAKCLESIALGDYSVSHYFATTDLIQEGLSVQI